MYHLLLASVLLANNVCIVTVKATPGGNPIQSVSLALDNSIIAVQRSSSTSLVDVTITYPLQLYYLRLGVHHLSAEVIDSAGLKGTAIIAAEVVKNMVQVK